MTELEESALAVIGGYHSDPFQYLGPHNDGGNHVIRVFMPHAEGITIIDDVGHESELPLIHETGLFVGPVDADTGHYRLRARFGSDLFELEDAYRFPPILPDADLHLLSEGTHPSLYETLGAHPLVLDGVAGVGFAVFAPNARRVSVVGDFNCWDGRRHAMRVRGNGYWEIFIPGVRIGDKYQYEVLGPQGLLPLKSDPIGFAAELRPSTASIVLDAKQIRSPRPIQHDANSLKARAASLYELLLRLNLNVSHLDDAHEAYVRRLGLR